ncbi:biotin-dependent carboxyltransferase family protein [Microlunatus elymi]|uniref:Biotin-dependent carboxyltransferase family protein n=1 Tax=Microlunatus elymi TaxID=2596828 RepID=A0A516PWX3_9ACTN|nr:biotin-dependent carboxyltransferase family protein [Microlunatus elymi]QDP95688.1 biotin-dependent carboxyltransferase family protein [Microlunatus elymi]
MITIEAPGPLALIEDLGRHGYAHLGVSTSGAADRGALRTANRLVGNADVQAAIEITLGGLRIRTDAPLWCAIAGPATTIMINNRAEPSHHPIHLEAGDQLGVLPPARGLRNYLAIRGGLEVPSVLGSRSTDLLSGLGPPRLAAGDRLHVGIASTAFPGADVTPQPLPPSRPTTIEVEAGPRTDWFTDDATAALIEQLWTVDPDSDRTAVRLHGRPLQRRNNSELPSEGLVRGAIQVPPSGLPLIFGSDHPVTGGYPVIAVATPDGCDRAAQLRPGDAVRFTLRSPVSSGPAYRRNADPYP